MGSFKDKNGKTRVGTALKGIKSFMQSKGMEVALDFADDVFPPLKVIRSIVDPKVKDLGVDDKASMEELLNNYNEERTYHLENTNAAREMYAEENETADMIAKKVIRENLIIISLLIIIQVAVIVYVNHQVAAVVTGVIGTVIGSLINERSTVINFFFGSMKPYEKKNK